jgi:hypothetical protein
MGMYLGLSSRGVAVRVEGPDRSRTCLDLGRAGNGVLWVHPIFHEVGWPILMLTKS